VLSKGSSLVLALALSALASNAFGQNAASSNSSGGPQPGVANIASSGLKPGVPNDGGTQDDIFLRVPAFNFSPYSSAIGTGAFGNVNRWVTSPSSSMEAGITLPGGALLTYLELDYCDTNATTHLTGNILECDNVGGNCSYVTSNLVSAGDGCSYVSANLTPLNHIVDNFHRILTGVVYTNSGDSTNSFASLIVGYKLQVSPAPGAATFTDVPTGDPGFQYIEALVASGITAGCGGGNYCPDSPLTRRQMAIFLSKALGLHWYGY